ncbi:MAG: AraC family transcriptional regulator [Gammaproteobacteria bacterium HGW-Gammaproteobacteria-15]|nr:MAG: AraC family transcriptional regulator [Gammaproteobacteria bacterium HGW-Gammaproteobacteria-15]
MPVVMFGHTDKNILLQHGITELLQLAQRRGGQLHKLLSGTHIFEPDLQKPLSRCNHRDWLSLISRCQQLHSPELPFVLANSILNNRTIALSQSLFVCANLAGSLRQLLYFRHQLLPVIYPIVQQHGNTLTLQLKPAISLGTQQHFVVTLAIAFIIQLIKQQLGTCHELKVQLTQDCPAFLAHFSGHWPCQLSFNQHVDAIHIPRSLWYQPFAGRDQQQLSQLTRSCYQLNKVLPNQRGVLEVLQRRIRRALPQLLSLDAAAGALGISGSSLKRLLQQHNTNFAALSDTVRRDTARLLLLQGQLSNRQLAIELGYSDEHNFRRAFKRWTGQVPSQFKNLPNPL